MVKYLSIPVESEEEAKTIVDDIYGSVLWNYKTEPHPETYPTSLGAVAILSENPIGMAKAQAENKVLKAALWHYGNRMGANIVEELKSGLPERIWRKINLREIEATDGEEAE